MSTSQPAALQALLSSLGVDLHDMPHVISGINLGQSVEFRDCHGVSFALWHDPNVNRLLVQPVPVKEPPDVCRSCSASLQPWEQTCPCCGFNSQVEQSRQ